ncbi:hypothetical protein DNTS_022891 [Danionella cerebrum]|uniref:CN hydrolase domain-containing protein n=1 Tax=Danionella cerebrum TaxID=2873325 RepID=A0A553RP67_9TELE|nr:hypothetical protein DNTS_022891 [Danionella translucida]
MRFFIKLRDKRALLSASVLALRSTTERKQSRMSTSLPVAAVCQVTSTPDKEANFKSCTRLVEQAKEGGASMVFLPEGFDYIGSSREETLALSESLDGDIITRYNHLARKLGVWLSLGGFHERGHDWESDRRIYNSHIIINGEGEVVSVYRKAHLFDVELTGKGVSLKESDFTIPGPQLVLLRARAIETQCFVLAAAQVGHHHTRRASFGHALAVDPWGELMGDCGPSDITLRLVQIDLKRLMEVRREMPVLQHRREQEFYCSLD